MRILYSHRIQSRDGQSVHVEALVSAFRAAGHEVLVIGPGMYDRASFGGESQAMARLRRMLPGLAQEIAEIAYNIPAYWRLRRALRRFRPDFVYERCNLFFLAGAWLARWHHVILYLEVNSPLAAERERFGGLRLGRLAFALERFTWRSATRVLSVTEVLRGVILDAGVLPERVQVVPNGVTLACFAPRPAHAMDAQGPDVPPTDVQAGGVRAPDAPATDPPAMEAKAVDAKAGGARVVLGFVGFMRAWHGLDIVISALARPGGKELTLVVVGDGPVRSELEQQAAALGVNDRVHFTGVVPREDVPAWVCRFDIALQPRVTDYASPLKVFDYMAAGCAIVAPDQPNIREVLSHGKTALLFDPADPVAFCEVIQILAQDAALRERLGRAARLELERREYTWDHNATRIADWVVQDAGVR